MPSTKNRPVKNGFTLLETMIALVVLAVGVLGLAAMLADALSYMQGSQEDFIAQQKAEEAAEAILTAKYSNNATFAQIANFGVGSPAGLFLPGPQPLLQPSPTGLVGSLDDVGQPPAYILQPGPDHILGTADDIKLPLSDFTRTISIVNIAGEPNLREVDITVNYRTGRFQRSYTMSTYVSAF
ncbi:MAG TPA: prepilin-type N-terminal cleavage/methylation domain-containing protein [Candidatus Acidoferrales bacterium]